jgi:hypothetical protein
MHVTSTMIKTSSMRYKKMVSDIVRAEFDVIMASRECDQRFRTYTLLLAYLYRDSALVPDLMHAWLMNLNDIVVERKSEDWRAFMDVYFEVFEKVRKLIIEFLKI